MKLSCVVPATSVCCQKIPGIFCSQHYVFTHTSSRLKWHASYEDDSHCRSSGAAYVKAEVAALGSLSLIVLMIYV